MEGKNRGEVSTSSARCMHKEKREEIQIRYAVK